MRADVYVSQSQFQSTALSYMFPPQKNAYYVVHLLGYGGAQQGAGAARRGRSWR